MINLFKNKQQQLNNVNTIPAVNTVKQQAVNDVLNSYIASIQNGQNEGTQNLVNQLGAEAVTNGIKQGLNFGNKDVADWENQYANGREGIDAGYRIPKTPEEINLAKTNNFNNYSPLSGEVQSQVSPQSQARVSGWQNFLNGLGDLRDGFNENAHQNFSMDNLQKRIDPNIYKQGINPEDYRTALTNDEQTQFDAWANDMRSKGAINQNDNFNDYDMQGYWKNEVLNNTNLANGNAQNHFTDKYKMPNHATFSNESQYATGENAKYAGKWNGDKFIAPRNENAMTKIGEVLGTAGKFASSPTGRGLIVGSLVGATGGNPLQMLAYGGSATVQNQKNRMNDQLYRSQLKQLGYTDEDLAQLGGYVDQNAYKTISDGVYKLQYGNYRNKKLDQDSYIKLKKYYDDQLKQGILDPVNYQANIKNLNDRFINDNIATANAGNVQLSNDTRKTNSTINLNTKRGNYLDIMSAEQPKRTGIMQQNANSNSIRANKAGNGGSGGYQAGTKGNGKKNPMYGSHLAEYNQILTTGDKNKINYARNNFIKVYGEDPDKAIKSENDILKYLED